MKKQILFLLSIVMVLGFMHCSNTKSKKDTSPLILLLNQQTPGGCGYIKNGSTILAQSTSANTTEASLKFYKDIATSASYAIIKANLQIGQSLDVKSKSTDLNNVNNKYYVYKTNLSCPVNTASLSTLDTSTASKELIVSSNLTTTRTYTSIIASEYTIIVEIPSISSAPEDVTVQIR